MYNTKDIMMEISILIKALFAESDKSEAEIMVENKEIVLKFDKMLNESPYGKMRSNEQISHRKQLISAFTNMDSTERLNILTRDYMSRIGQPGCNAANTAIITIVLFPLLAKSLRVHLGKEIWND
jgi:hypothetical protein